MNRLLDSTRRQFFANTTGFGIGSLGLGALFNERLFAGEGLHHKATLTRNNA